MSLEEVLTNPPSSCGAQTQMAKMQDGFTEMEEIISISIATETDVQPQVQLADAITSTEEVSLANFGTQTQPTPKIDVQDACTEMEVFTAVSVGTETDAQHQVQFADAVTATEEISLVTFGTQTQLAPKTETQDASTEMQIDEFLPISTGSEIDAQTLPTTPAPIAAFETPGPNYQNENQENLPPPPPQRLPRTSAGSTSDHDISDQTLPGTMEELEFARRAKRQATTDRVVPIMGKHLKIEPVFRTQRKLANPSSSNIPSSSLTSRQLNIRLYDLDYMEEPQIIEDIESCDDDENATVPELKTSVSNPYLRLGLSRRSRPRKPLHENFLNEMNQY